MFLQSSIISINQQLLNLEFLLITYQSIRVRWEGIDKTELKCKKCINNDVGDEKHNILYCNAPDIAKLRTMFFKDNNKLARIRSECASSFIEGILATSKGTPQLIGKFLNGIIEFLKDK